MNGLNFNAAGMKLRLFIFLLLIAGLSVPVHGKTIEDSLSHKKPWYVPDGVVVQHAGNIGYLALGPSYNLFHNKVTVDILYGFVPKFQAQEVLHMGSLRMTYQPYRIKLSEQYSVSPLRIGLGASFYFDDDLSLGWDREYPKGYYWWSEAVRVLGFAGASLNRRFGEDKFIKEVQIYSEVGTYDLVVTSWVRDESIKFGDILSLSIGLRASF